MKRLLTCLLLLLVAQAGLVAAVFWPREAAIGDAGAGFLGNFSATEVDELRIGDEFGNEALLVRSAGRWLLPDLGDLPADPERVSQLLLAIEWREGEWPVARTTAARQRFQVADYYHQRRISVLRSGAAMAEIYLGTAPGFRKVHAREDGSDDIFSIQLSTFDAPPTSSGWLEPRLLQVRTPLRIVSDSYALQYADGSWTSGSGGKPDPGELEALLDALRKLQVDGVAREDLQRELAVAEATLTLAVTSLAGGVTLELFELEGEYYVHSSEYPVFFKLSAYDFDRLTGIDFALISGG